MPAVVALCLLNANAVRAQEPKQDAQEAPKPAAAPKGEYLEMTPEPPTLRGWSRMQSARDTSFASTAKLMLAGTVPINLAQFDKFFNTQLFPQFTIYQIDPNVTGKDQTNVLVIDADEKVLESNQYNQRSRLPDMRRLFRQQYFDPCNDEITLSHVADMTVEAMRKIALENYHPLARYNAVLLLASLHEFRQSDKPYAKTWPVFVDCLDSIGPVKVAAMYSILHHIKSLPPDLDLQTRMRDRLNKILIDKTVAKGETPEGHDWLRRRAIDVLVAMGDSGANAKVIADLVAILNDPQSSVELACSAAKALGSIRSSALATLDLSAVTASVGRVAVSATRAELARAEDRAFGAPLPVLTASAGTFGPTRRPDPTPVPDAAADAAAAPAGEQYISVARLKSQLTALEAGFKGPGGGLVAAATGTAHVQNVARIQVALTALKDVCDDKAGDYATLKQQLEKGADALEGKLGKAAVAPNAAPAAGKAAGRAADGFEDLDKTAPASTNAKVPAAK